MADYKQRLLGVLEMSRSSLPSMPSTMSFPTGMLNTDGGIIATVTPYVLWVLLFIFIVSLILIIINYTVYPIFNFGNNPNALITVPQTQWVPEWKTDTAKSTNTVPTANYSFLFDVKITNPAGSTTTTDTFVLLYKSTSGTAPSTTLAATVDPSLVVVYDSLASKIYVYFTTKMQNNNSFGLQVVSCECIPGVPYRIGIVVSNSFIELYMNGSYMSSKSFGGQTVAGTDTDHLYSSPVAYAKNVSVANLFIANYVASSGEIKAMGGPALA